MSSVQPWLSEKSQIMTALWRWRLIPLQRKHKHRSSSCSTVVALGICARQNNTCTHTYTEKGPCCNRRQLSANMVLWVQLY